MTHHVHSLTLKLRPDPLEGDASHLFSVETPAITILVGPNNSGKSQLLNDIFQYVRENVRPTILHSIECRLPNNHEEFLSIMEHAEADSPDHRRLYFLPGSTLCEVNNDSFIEHVLQRAEELTQLTLRPSTIRLDGSSRLGALAGNATAGDLAKRPTNHLQKTLQDPAFAGWIAEKSFDAFHRHLVVDYTQLGQLRPRLASMLPAPEVRLSIDPKAVAYFSAQPEASAFSDGVRAYLGILLVACSFPYRLVLIDEPEAFLHPPLARRLGSELGRHLLTASTQLIVATHSASFIVGAIESGASINILHMEYDGTSPAFTCMQSQEILELMQDPLMRTSHVLSALFHRGAVVSEADADRVLYDEVNHRLNATTQDGCRDTIFLNAQNKQTALRVAGKLRRMGIPAAAVVDFDAIFDGMTQQLGALNVPHATLEGIKRARQVVADDLTPRRDELKRKGLTALQPGTSRRQAEDLLRQLEAYGIFVSPNGELEGWLSNLDVQAQKPLWLNKVLERMGADPRLETYVKPEAGDIWAFVRAIATWLNNPQRLGMKT